MIGRWFVLALIIFLTGSMACQDELRDRYQSPNSIATPNVGDFFTAMLNNDRTRPSYWNLSTFINWHVGVYTQSVGYLNSQSMYQQNESYIQNRWDDYYRPGSNGSGAMANFREMEKIYSSLSETEKKEVEVLMQAAKVILYDETSQMVDLWGDIPFTEAGSLNSSGKIVYPKFDSAEEIYAVITDDLKVIGDYFSSAEVSQSAMTQFSKQDILLSGNLENWRRYTNSLRLRLLMRLSFVQEEKSKTEVLELLNNESQYPLLNLMSYAPEHDDILLNPLSTYSTDLHDAFTDWTNYPAPYYALEEVLKPANDLRIPVLYDKYGATTNSIFNSNTEYKALPLTFTSIEQQENLEHYAVIDSTTFLFNTQLPGVVFTASEVSFLKAEAYERWGGGDASLEYFNGIKNSILFYFYLNSLNNVKITSLVPPAGQEIDNFLSNAASLQYIGSTEEKLSKIWTQKWVHFGFLQSVQSWSEMRRTKYPQLSFYPSSRAGYELPPQRLTYPDNEKNYNYNYAAVASKDFRSSKIFWDVK
jgi:hypothetical protein